MVNIDGFKTEDHMLLDDYIIATLRDSHRVLPAEHKPGDHTNPCMEPAQLMNQVIGNYFSPEVPMDPIRYNFAIKELLEEGLIGKRNYSDPSSPAKSTKTYEVIMLTE
ncbi:hypothetical protein HOA92_05325 [archaeon]|mgnify:FL=1|jgi:hypothetical protein|nr:hypothetical protein [archaeon]MBT6762436.1 hypothetical protein [archaeon]